MIDISLLWTPLRPRTPEMPLMRSEMAKNEEAAPTLSWSLDYQEDSLFIRQ